MIKRVFNIITIVVVIISVISIPYNFIRWLRDSYYLKLDEKNISEINLLLNEEDKLPETAKKIGYMGGLGDWYFIIKYNSGLQERRIYGENSNIELRDYIIQNGYSEGELASNELAIALVIIGIATIYGIIELNNVMKKRKIQKE